MKIVSEQLFLFSLEKPEIFSFNEASKKMIQLIGKFSHICFIVVGFVFILCSKIKQKFNTINFYLDVLM